MASIKKNFAYNILLNLSNFLFPFITGPYTARVLEPDGIGLASFAGNYAGYFVLFTGMGYSAYSLREVAKLRDDRTERQRFVGQMFTLLMINACIIYSIYIGTIFLIPQMREYLIIYLIAGTSILFVPFNIQWYFEGMERFGFTTSRNLIIRCCAIVALFIFVKSKSDLYIYMILNLISTVGSVFWSILEMKRDGVVLKIENTGIRRHYKPMLVLFASSVAISIYTMIDTLMLGIMSDYSEVGYYRNATSIAKTVLAVVTSLSAVAVPRVAYYVKQKDFEAMNQLILKSFRIISFLAIPSMVGLICIAPTFVPLFYGEAFRQATVPLMIMSGVIVAIGFNNLTGVQILIGMGFDKLFLKCVLVGTFSNFAMNLALIPLLGASGAAASSVTAESLILLATIVCVRKNTMLRFRHIGLDIFKATFASLLFIPIAIGIGHVMDGWPSVFAIIASCALVYPLAQKLMKSDGYEMMASVLFNFLKLRK